MSRAKAKTKWDWSVWLKLLEESDMPEKAKAIGREVPTTMRKSKRALVPWEMPSRPSYCDMSPLVIAGLLHLVPGNGCYQAIIDPLPKPGEIAVTADERHILRWLLKGLDLYYTEPASRYSSPGWTLRSFDYKQEPGVNGKAAKSLLCKGVLEWDGCGNWPIFDHRRYGIRMRSLCGITGFRAMGLRWINERMQAADKPRDGAN